MNPDASTETLQAIVRDATGCPDATVQVCGDGSARVKYPRNKIEPHGTLYGSEMRLAHAWLGVLRQWQGQALDEERKALSARFTAWIEARKAEDASLCGEKSRRAVAGIPGTP